MTLISVDGYEPAHLSYSTVSSYRSCGKRFQLEKILRVESRPGLASTGGSAVHKATELIDHALFSGLPLDIVAGGDV